MKDKKVLIAYDISANKRRRKVADSLERCGMRINKSVFICTLSRELDLPDLVEMVTSLIDRRDHVFFLPLCKGCYEAAWSVGAGTAAPRSRRKRKNRLIG